MLLPLVDDPRPKAPRAEDHGDARAAAVRCGTRREEGRHRAPAWPRRFLVRLREDPDSFRSTHLSFGRDRVDDLGHTTI
jgi:hypothetical protein